MEFTKSERRVLRGIAGEVYEAEAHRMLERLDATFQRWRDGEVPSSELIREIHEFHQHDSRDLWSIYSKLQEMSVVARGVALELVPESRVPGDILVKLQPLIDLQKQWARDPGPQADDDE